MPQALLPLIPDGATQVNDRLSVVQENGEWTYFVGAQPIFSHAAFDRASFRMFTSQLIVQGTCRKCQITRTFGVSKQSVNRNVTKYLEGGSAAFYQPRKGRAAAVFTEAVVARAEQLLNEGKSRSQVAEELGVKKDSLSKAIQHGRVREPSRPEECEGGAECEQGEAVVSPPASTVSDRSQRAEQDAAAAELMGTACTRPGERMLAALGMLDGAPTKFEVCRDVSYGGVLCALPALAANGLFHRLEECFRTLSGYYTTLQVMTLLAYMALCRIKTVEQLQYESPGELGKLMGLDRVPEVRCLRSKLAALSAEEAPENWAALLSRDWLEASPEWAGTLYVDGHVRVYHGRQTALPKRYVARERLCLRGTTDYWVNDAVGRPFFVVERPIDQGLLEAMTNDVVPRLLEDVPNQPTSQELQDDPYRCRFTIVFDREGYSPAFFKRMWQQHRIACLSYHKFPKGDWPQEEFQKTELLMPHGERVVVLLAERGSWVGDKKNGLWMREVRKLTASGHQTSLITSRYDELAPVDAAGMFSRWSQENFFRYAMQHFAIDLLSDYQTQEIPGTNRPVINPAWRELERSSRSLKSKLTLRQSRFAALTLHPEADESKLKKWEQQKADLKEEIEQLEHKLEEVKRRKKETPQHLEWDELSEEHKFQCLAPSRKRLMDTVRMIAYRAETAMVATVREELKRHDDARSLLRDLFRSEADLLPDAAGERLQIDVHSFANSRSNRAIAHLLSHLNAAELTYPGTKLKLVYTLGGRTPE